MRKPASILKKTGAVLLAVLLCTAPLTGCYDKQNTNPVAQRVAELLAAGQPTIYDSIAPFTLGGLTGEPSEDEPWWTLEYGGFPVISSSAMLGWLAEDFAEAHIGYPNRAGSTQFVTGDDRGYIMEQFLERNEYGGGEYYDYERGIRFERASTNLLLLTEVNQNDRDYLESKGGKVTANEIARTALVFMVPSDFPADNLTLEQLKDVLSGGITDWTSLGSNLPISLHYSLDDEFLRHMLDARVLHGAAMAGTVIEEEEMGTLTGSVMVPYDVPYDNRPGSVGIFTYGRAPDMDDAKILTIEGAAPSEETIRSGEYPVIAGCYAVYWETDRDNAPGRFVEWCASEEGAGAIRASGLIPVH